MTDLAAWRMDWPPASAAGRRVEAVTHSGETVAGELAIVDTLPGAGEPIPVFEIRPAAGPPVELETAARWRFL